MIEVCYEELENIENVDDEINDKIFESIKNKISNHYDIMYENEKNLKDLEETSN